MKNIIIVFFIIVIIALAGGIIFLVLSKSGKQTPSQSSTSTLITTTSVDQSDDEEGSETDSGCPEGIICLGGDSVASAPTITVGKDADYLQDASDTDPDQNGDQGDNGGDSNNGEIVITPTTPLDVIIANKDYKIWSIVWVTSAAQTGYVKYGTSESDLSRQASDARDASVSAAEQRFTHHVTITNTDSELEQDNLTFYFKIVSGEQEYDNNGSLYQYANAPLTSSPSSPQSIAISTNRLAQFQRDDYVVITRLKNDASSSSPVSASFTSESGIELVIGISRNESLSSYFPISSSTEVEVRIYGPDGYTGYLSSVTYGALEGEILDISMYETGYTNEGTFSPTYGNSSYTIGADTNGGTPVPSTGIENEVLFKAVWGGVIISLGLVTLILFIPWNHKRMWESRMVKEIERSDDVF